jgi:hypothetical protein
MRRTLKKEVARRRAEFNLIATDVVNATVVL